MLTRNTMLTRAHPGGAKAIPGNVGARPSRATASSDLLAHGPRTSFDLLGLREERRRRLDSVGSRRAPVEHHLEFGRLLHEQAGGLFAFGARGVEADQLHRSVTVWATGREPPARPNSSRTRRIVGTPPEI